VLASVNTPQQTLLGFSGAAGEGSMKLVSIREVSPDLLTSRVGLELRQVEGHLTSPSSLALMISTRNRRGPKDRCENGARGWSLRTNGPDGSSIRSRCSPDVRGGLPYAFNA